ncbi:hypothetical protein I79_011667 [Cricetulus griseus]|uniref:Uncharacterized protein n=1 Tax=Cricetulus griseus TaxID=10029 RepID=G3HLS3_CRIGR|nr:hypothetical protein I79_011667 [Cricetulus griseus]
MGRSKGSCITVKSPAPLKSSYTTSTVAICAHQQPKCLCNPVKYAPPPGKKNPKQRPQTRPILVKALHS